MATRTLADTYVPADDVTPEAAPTRPRELKRSDAYMRLIGEGKRAEPKAEGPTPGMLSRALEIGKQAIDGAIGFGQSDVKVKAGPSDAGAFPMGNVLPDAMAPRDAGAGRGFVNPEFTPGEPAPKPTVLDQPAPEGYRAPLDMDERSPERREREAMQRAAADNAVRDQIGPITNPRLVDTAAEAVSGAFGGDRTVGGQVARKATQTAGDVLATTTGRLPAQTLKLAADIGQLLTAGGTEPISRFAQAMDQAAQATMSGKYAAQAARMREIMQDGNASLVDVVGFLASNPEYAVDEAIPAIGAFGGAKVGAEVGERLMLLVGTMRGAGAAETRALAERGAMAGMQGANVAMNAGSTFSDTQSADLADKYGAAAIAGAGTALAGRAFDGGAERALIKGATGARTRLGSIAGTAGKEFGQEAIEQVSQDLGQALGEGRSPDLNELAKSAAQAGTLGAIAGGGTGAATHRAEPQAMSAEQMARERGFLRPTEQRKAINDRLDDFAATHGVAPEAVEKIKKRGQTRPLAELTDYYKRAIGVLAQAGIHKGPVDEQALGSLDEPQPAVPRETPAQPSEPTGLADPIDAGELLGTIDEAAHEGATSPLSDRPEPTQAQKEAGNYPMGHVRVGGLDISIENPEGSVRKGVDADGTPWESTLYAHYGYIKGSNAKDGDHLDVFIKPGTPETYSGPVWVIDQIDQKTGKYDEAKAILGASSEDEARRIYLANYDQTGPQRIGAITGMPMGAFRAWAKSAEARKPLGDLNGRPGNPAPLAAGADVRPAADLEGSARNLLGVGASEGGRTPAIAAAPVASSTEAAPVRAGSGEPTGALSNAGAAAETSTGDKARGAGAAETVAPAPGVANQRTKPKSSEVSQQRQTTPGTDLLRAINRAGGIAPSLLHDLSVRAETNLIDRKTGKKRSAWANPRLDRQQLFRHGGRADLLELAETLEGEGYIEPGLVKRDYKAASEKVIELVRAAIEKKDVAREFDPNAIEAEMQRRREMAMGYPDYDAESAREAEAERQAIMAEANLTHPEVAAATTSDVTAGATEPDTAQAMRAMGFDDEDIEHVNEQARLAASEEADRAAQESTAEDHGAAAREAHAPDEAGGGAPGDRPQEGLTLEAQTPESLAAKSERELQAQRADEAEQKRLADKAKADAQRDEFHLTGSDRAADENPNQGTLLEPGAPQYTGRDVPLDLFPETLPADTGSGGNRLGPGATQSRDVPAATGVPRANTLAIRPDPTHPGLYHVNSQLVEVGRREIPVASVKNWDDAITALQALNRYAVEHFDVLVTDKNGKPLAIIGSFKGARSQAPVYPATLLGEALRIKGAAQAWGVHNHPSATHTLSSADQFMNGNLARTFSPSTIEWMGTAAIGGNRYQVAEKTGGSVYDGDVQPGNKPTTVPIAERTIVPNNQSLPVLDSPDRVMRWTKQITQGGPGIVFVDNALRVSAWVPIANPEELGQLRQDGRFDRLVNSANEAGAAGAFIVNPGSAFSSRVLDNIASALNLADVKTIDVIDTATSESAAEQLRMPDAGGPVFSIADAAATNPSGQMRTHGLPRDLIEIHTARSTDALKAHPDYTAAKAGDAEAAARLVEALVTPENLAAAKKFGADVMWAYPHAEEATGRNAIPSMLANKYAAQTGGTVAEPIVQTNRAFHAGADAMQRMIARPVFDGPVQRGARYVLVDDVSTMGSTLAELANHITANGGQVVGVATLANSGRAPTIPAEPGQTKLLEKRYGDTIRELFQVEPAALTRDEARYLTGFRSADELRNRAAAAARARTERLRAKGLRQEDARLSVGGERSGEAAPHGTVTEADRAAVKQLQQSLRRQVAGLVLDANPARATPAGQEPTRDERRRIAAAELIERGFGKRVIYFDSDRPLANGVFSSEQPGVIFVWKNAERPFRAVVGHEMLHALRADRPGLYARLRAQLLPLIRPDIEERFTLLNAKYDQLGMKRLGRGALEEEFIADVLGDNFDDRKFWSRVGKADGIKGVLQEILHWLDDLIAKLTNRPNFVGNFGTAEYLTDVRKARDIVAAVVREYRAGETSEQSDTQTADGDGPKLSVDRHTTEQREALASTELAGSSGGTPPPALPEQTASDNPERARGYRARVQNLLTRLDNTVNGLGGLPDTDTYLAQRYLALGKIAAIDKVAGEIRATFRKADAADKKAIYDYLTTRGATADGIKNEEVRALAQRAKHYIGTVGDELVKRGLLSEASREEYRDRYLPRMYLAHLLGDGEWRAIGAGKKVSDMGYLKSRKDIPQEIRDVILGEVKDPAFLAGAALAKPMRDMALLDWLQQISGNKQWVLPESLVEWAGRKVTPYWLKAEATALRERARHYPEPENASKARAVAEKMEAAASSVIGPRNHEDYKQIPDTPQFGRLRGMFVRREIYDDLLGARDFVPTDPGWAQKVFGYGGLGTKVTQLWKMSKVSLNPPGQIRNVVSNAVMMQLSGVPLHRFPTLLARAITQIRNGGTHFKIAQKYGVTESTFQAQELFRAKRDLIDLERDVRGATPWVAIKSAAALISDFAGDAYQAAEVLFKVVKIIDAMEHGMNEQQAALEAQKWLFDYSLIDRNLRYLRSAPVGSPFVTYTAKVLPRLLEVAALHPQRFLPWVALYYGLQMWAQAAFGGDDDDWKHLKKALPQWMQDKGHVAFLPFRDDAGRLQAVDMGYFFPWSNWTELAMNLGEGKIGDAIKNFGLFGGPVTDIITAIRTGEDPFTKRPIVNAADPPMEQAKAYTAYAWDMAMPPFLGSHGVVSPLWAMGPEYGGKLAQAVEKSTNRYGDERATAGQAAARLVGVNAYGIDPEKTRASNMAQMRSEIGKTRAAMRSRLSDRGLSPERQREIQRAYMEELRARAKKLEDYGRESTPPEFAKKKPTDQPALAN